MIVKGQWQRWFKNVRGEAFQSLRVYLSCICVESWRLQQFLAISCIFWDSNQFLAFLSLAFQSLRADWSCSCEALALAALVKTRLSHLPTYTYTYQLTGHTYSIAGFTNLFLSSRSVSPLNPWLLSISLFTFYTPKYQASLSKIWPTR